MSIEVTIEITKKDYQTRFPMDPLGRPGYPVTLTRVGDPGVSIPMCQGLHHFSLSESEDTKKFRLWNVGAYWKDFECYLIKNKIEYNKIVSEDRESLSLNNYIQWNRLIDGKYESITVSWAGTPLDDTPDHILAKVLPLGVSNSIKYILSE